MWSLLEIRKFHPVSFMIETSLKPFFETCKNFFYETFLKLNERRWKHFWNFHKTCLKHQTRNLKLFNFFLRNTLKPSWNFTWNLELLSNWNFMKLQDCWKYIAWASSSHKYIYSSSFAQNTIIIVVFCPLAST